MQPFLLLSLFSFYISYVFHRIIIEEKINTTENNTAKQIEGKKKSSKSNSSLFFFRCTSFIFSFLNPPPNLFISYPLSVFFWISIFCPIRLSRSLFLLLPYFQLFFFRLSCSGLTSSLCIDGPEEDPAQHLKANVVLGSLNSLERKQSRSLGFLFYIFFFFFFFFLVLLLVGKHRRILANLSRIILSSVV